MFSIIISEKGGAERRETFDKNEINVGRVQGNDLMLPKGNVSKHHARLLYRDGRFIVTDLKSTNGTYVNGKKIAQATIVREGDKIYIGDFILRVDLASAPEDGVTAEPPMPPPGMPMGMPPLPPHAGPTAPPGPGPMPMQQQPMQPMGMPAPMAPMAPMPPTPMPVAPMPAPVMAQPMPMPQPMLQQPQTAQPMMPVVQQTQPPARPNPRPEPGAVSHYPLERDPDEHVEQAPPAARMPAPPRVPSMPNVQVSQQQQASPRGGGTLAIAGRPPSVAPPAPARVQPMPSRIPPRETPAQAGKRLALVTLVDRVAEATDLAPLRSSTIVSDDVAQRIEAAVRDQARGMKDEDGMPEGVDVESLIRDATRELVGTGAVGPLLDDDEVSEIHCLRYDQVLVMKAGLVQLADCSYTSDEALGRAIARLAQQVGDPVKRGDSFAERRLARGAHMMAFLPPSSPTHGLVIRKRRRIEMSLEDFVRLGAMSRMMASFLETCLVARANILVCASSHVAAVTFLGALSSAGAPGDRVGIVQDEEELSAGAAAAVRVTATSGRADEVVRSLARIRADRLFVPVTGRAAAAAVLDVIAEGAEGVVATVSAPSLRQGLSRLAAQVLVARAGISADAARELVGEGFDIAVEVHQLPDGRYRIVRMAELAGADAKGVVARDIFTAAAEGSGEAHAATGVVPRIVAEFAARGIRVDTNLFKKAR